MVTFTVPATTNHKKSEKGQFRFAVPTSGVVLAGSRNREVPEAVCSRLVETFGSHGFSFLIGCARGADRSFRKALSGSPWEGKTLVACAFQSRTGKQHSFGLYASKVVPDNLPPKAALHRRTVWMVKRCCMLVLFPEDPTTGTWGKGSSLAFRTAMYHVKPVFVATEKPPKKSIHYRVVPDVLFGFVSGYWVVPLGVPVSEEVVHA